MPHILISFFYSNIVLCSSSNIEETIVILLFPEKKKDLFESSVATYSFKLDIHDKIDVMVIFHYRKVEALQCNVKPFGI